MRFKLYKERAGVVSEGPIWVCGYECYLHMNGSLLKLLWEVLTEFRSDRHLGM